MLFFSLHRLLAYLGFLSTVFSFSNCRIPCHIDCVTENSDYSVRSTRCKVNSRLKGFLEAGYAVDNKFKMARYLRRWLRGTQWL